jgi:MFS family permease
VLKFLWAPLVDRLGSRRLWIRLSLALLAVVTAILAGADPVRHAGQLAALLLLYVALSATQDIAIDAYTIETTHGRELGVANSVRIGAYRGASFVSSALLVWIAGRSGWQPAFLAGAGLFAGLALAAGGDVGGHHERAHPLGITMQHERQLDFHLPDPAIARHVAREQARLLDAQLVAILQLIVYAGAIVILFLFIIMLLNLQAQDRVMGGAPLVATAVANAESRSELAASRRRIVAASEGNPLFVEEMLALAVDGGAAESELEVPPTIQALLAARIDRLPAASRTALQRASVMGRIFMGGALAHLSPELDDVVRLEDRYGREGTSDA